MKTVLGALPLLVLWALPLLAGVALAGIGAFDAAAWHALLAHPQLWPGLGLSLWTGTAAAALALLLALVICGGLYRSTLWRSVQQAALGGLAVPHLAFAIGLGFLIMPSGWLARLAIGGANPPQWTTTQDPAGIWLTAVLVLKELPFLIALIAGLLSRGDLAASLEGHWRAARSLGHGGGSIWWRVAVPQLVPRLIWPVVAVWSYGATVADVALVIGPTQPPTLAVIVWHDLNDAAAAINARGLAGALFLALTLAAAAAAAGGAFKLTREPAQRWLAQGPSALQPPMTTAGSIAALLIAVYAAVLAVLAILSATPRWPYPALWPDRFEAVAWLELLADAAPLVLSMALAAAAAAVALLLAILWLETQPERRDRGMIALAFAALVLPQLTSAAGQYLLLTRLGLAGTVAGLFLVHLTPVLAYVLIVLSGPYRGLDPRYAAVAQGLGAGRWQRWFKVKAPLLRAPLLMAGAIGFSVSMVQFVPAQLVAAGRHATLPIEAVTLAAGGNRALTAAAAVILTLPVLAVFAAAGWLGRPRWR